MKSSKFRDIAMGTWLKKHGIDLSKVENQEPPQLHQPKILRGKNVELILLDEVTHMIDKHGGKKMLTLGQVLTKIAADQAVYISRGIGGASNLLTAQEAAKLAMARVIAIEGMADGGIVITIDDQMPVQLGMASCAP